VTQLTAGSVPVRRWLAEDAEDAGLGLGRRRQAGALALLGDHRHDLVDVHAAAAPGGLVALRAFNGVAHVFLLGEGKGFRVRGGIGDAGELSGAQKKLRGAAGSRPAAPTLATIPRWVYKSSICDEDQLPARMWPPPERRRREARGRSFPGREVATAAAGS